MTWTGGTTPEGNVNGSGFNDEAPTDETVAEGGPAEGAPEARNARVESESEGTSAEGIPAVRALQGVVNTDGTSETGGITNEGEDIDSGPISGMLKGGIWSVTTE